MSSVQEIIGQVNALTRDLIELGLSDRQTFPIIRSLPNGVSEIGIPQIQDISYVLRNVPYSVMYDKLEETGNYNIIERRIDN